VIRKLTDDTLVVFLSDSHIGGEEGRDIFESPDDLAALFESLDDHAGPLELVLAGDFFDFLRIADVPEGQNRASATISKPEYGTLFEALRRVASGPSPGSSKHTSASTGTKERFRWSSGSIRARLGSGCGSPSGSCWPAGSPLNRTTTLRLAYVREPH
jgi:hypothetical protein